MAMTWASFSCSSSSSSIPRSVRSTLQIPHLKNSAPRIANPEQIKQFSTRRDDLLVKRTTSPLNVNLLKSLRVKETDVQGMQKAKLYAVLEAIGDRIEMHKNIGEQRQSWNTLLLNSTNMMTLTATTMAGIASMANNMGVPILALKISSTLLFAAATGILVIMNKIQPSQLAEEQRNAVRLFKQLESKVQTTLALNISTEMEVKDVMDCIVALDEAFPLPLLGAMIEKFPKSFQPATWWACSRQNKEQYKRENIRRVSTKSNGWSEELEAECRKIVEVIKRKDGADYAKLGNKVLHLSKMLAIFSRLLTAVATIASAFVGSPAHGPWAVLVAAIGGVLATTVNTIEHGGQVGMVYEMYRNSAGFFKHLEEKVETALEEEDLWKRENGEVFEMKMALSLGRSLSELRELAAATRSCESDGRTDDEFACKLF
ncbi:hypothetical protein Droror1_Dr00003980 [Drosera rotundifolia]